MRHALLTILVFGLLTASHGQNITATVSKQSILIGDQVQLSVVVDPGNWQAEGLILDGMESEDAIEIVDPGQLVKNDQSGVYEQTLLITSFDSGTQYIPQIGAVLKRLGRLDTIYSRTIPLNVNTVTPDSLGLAPVKPIMEEEKIWSDYLIYFIPLLLLLILGLALWWWSKRPKHEAEAVIETPLPPPHIEAMASLAIIKEEKAWEKGAFKAFESQISLLIRRYVERQFGFPAMEWTTREIIQFIGQKHQSDEVPTALLQDILSMSDLVKYAKSDPGIEAHAAQINKCETFIQSTQHLIQEEE